jgi:hypothetical protein
MKMEDRNENTGEKQAVVRGDFKEKLSSRLQASVIQFLNQTFSASFIASTDDMQ